jgi:hypothetical protein
MIPSGSVAILLNLFHSKDELHLHLLEVSSSAQLTRILKDIFLLGLRFFKLFKELLSLTNSTKYFFVVQVKFRSTTLMEDTPEY